ncbi:MAG: hypothetical protein JSV51_02240 [Candidatus Bathyarchaeota archaeon]|nr:MAG: hypothetical protein JSV51_02240 [Candidatus Bathyarchaeota archaeon]
MSEVEGVGRVRVKLRVGDVDVEVECGVSEVGSVVDEILRVFSEREDVISGRTIGGETIRSVGRGETCKGLILGLWRDEWFGIGRSLGEVHGELGRGGYHYDRTAVAHALVDLVREGVLTRLGRPRSYQYVQKRPPPAIKAKSKNIEE